MSSAIVGLIIVLVLLLVLVGVIYYAYRNIKRKVSRFSQTVFGTSDLIEGIKQRDLEVASTPKSDLRCDQSLSATYPEGFSGVPFPGNEEPRGKCADLLFAKH